jgi:outer membrane autotransporter protein
MGDAILTPSIDLAWVHEFSDTRDLDATLTSLPGSAFVVEGARPPRDGAHVRTGVELLMSPRATLYADLEGDLATHSDSYAGKVGVRFAW